MTYFLTYKYIKTCVEKERNFILLKNIAIFCNFCLLPEQHRVECGQPRHLGRPHISRQNGGGGGIALAGEHLTRAAAEKRDLQSDRKIHLVILYIFWRKGFLFWLKDIGFKTVSWFCCFCSHCCCTCCCCCCCYCYYCCFCCCCCYSS